MIERRLVGTSDRFLIYAMTIPSGNIEDAEHPAVGNGD
jgi:hypothetical protein